jgi:hypothetical protein
MSSIGFAEQFMRVEFQQTVPARIHCTMVSSDDRNTMVLSLSRRARVAMLSRMGAKTSHQE